VDFLFDENVDQAIVSALRRERPEITVCQIGGHGAPAWGTPDPEILIWCEQAGFALVTNNRASMPVHLQSHLAVGRHVPAVFVLGHDSSVREILADLALIWEAAHPGEFADQIVYLPL
jgi:hypothetical protein